MGNSEDTIKIRLKIERKLLTSNGVKRLTRTLPGGKCYFEMMICFVIIDYCRTYHFIFCCNFKWCIISLDELAFESACSLKTAFELLAQFSWSKENLKFNISNVKCAVYFNRLIYIKRNEVRVQWKARLPNGWSGPGSSPGRSYCQCCFQ